MNKNKIVTDVNVTDNSEDTSKEILYSTIYYFGMGSRRVIIYKDGDVYDDVEIESAPSNVELQSPSRKKEYEYRKTLTDEELEEISNIVETAADRNTINDYAIQLIYGVKKIDATGEYRY